jgi:hypothetical protein
VNSLAKFLVLASCSIAPVTHLNAELPASTPENTKICGIVGYSVEGIRNEVTSTDRIVFHETIGDYDTYVDDSQRRLWTFVRKESAKPPAAICRTVEPHQSGSIVNMQILCFGEKKACQTLKAEWQAFLDSVLSGQTE